MTSLNCTEGTLVKWERDDWDDWDSQACAPIPDPSLRCGEPMGHFYTTFTPPGICFLSLFSTKVQRFI